MYPTSADPPPFFGGGCKRVGQHKLTFFLFLHRLYRFALCIIFFQIRKFKWIQRIATVVHPQS